jgi:hypothetical protein
MQEMQFPRTLNLSELTTKFQILTMFVMVDLQTIFHMWNTGMLMIYLCTRFYVLGSNSSLVIAIKSEAEEYFLTVPILFYILQKYYLTKKFQSLLPHIIHYLWVSRAYITSSF